MPIPILTDSEVLPLLDMDELVPPMEEFLHAYSAGSAVTPPRHAVAFDPYGRLVFTIGGLHHQGRSLAGFRAYDTFKTSGAEDEQIVAVWDSSRSALVGLVLGDSLGEWRTGALGGVAVKHMSRPDATTCAVIGTGRQARTQLLAVAACRTLSEVRVYGRTAERRRQFADELAAETKLHVWATDTTREAVEGVDIVLCATNSRTPILDTAWLAPGTHVNTVGPKTLRAHELPFDIAARVTLIATDLVEQVNAYPEPYFLSDKPVWTKLQELAGLIKNNGVASRTENDISLFCSAGLAGTEILAAAHVLERHRMSKQHG
ncbi:ornithine cyclodeaminase family protein [Acidiphilium sp.]|uniref:ornithine cyclodeaminase family protein n=1 Tax=Acidiphilium sp. TaxID=527 RepID=UPI003D02AEF0